MLVLVLLTCLTLLMLQPAFRIARDSRMSQSSTVWLPLFLLCRTSLLPILRLSLFHCCVTHCSPLLIKITNEISCQCPATPQSLSRSFQISSSGKSTGCTHMTRALRYNCGWQSTLSLRSASTLFVVVETAHRGVLYVAKQFANFHGVEFCSFQYWNS